MQSAPQCSCANHRWDSSWLSSRSWNKFHVLGLGRELQRLSVYVSNINQIISIICSKRYVPVAKKACGWTKRSKTSASIEQFSISRYGCRILDNQSMMKEPSSLYSFLGKHSLLVERFPPKELRRESACAGSDWRQNRYWYQNTCSHQSKINWLQTICNHFEAI